jgi:hypothetical protein
VRDDVAVLIVPSLNQRVVVVLPELPLVAEEQVCVVGPRNIGERRMTKEEAVSLINQVYGECASGREEERRCHLSAAVGRGVSCSGIFVTFI